MKNGWAIWITGLPASGKTTIAKKLHDKLKDLKINAHVIESDELRKVLTPNPNYSSQERSSFYNSMIYIGTLLSGNGINVIFDAVANKKKWRDKARENIEQFMEIYVNTPLSVCKERDPKGIYEKAEKGKSNTVPGVQADYEKPINPEIIVDGTVDPCKSTKKILKLMEKNGFISL